MNIYVGNLSYDVSESDLKELFAKYGNVISAKIISDMHTGKSRGFGFVEMESKDQSETAIAELNGKDFSGRQLVVNEARPKRPSGGGGGGFRSDRNNDRGDRNDRDRGDRRDRGGPPQRR